MVRWETHSEDEISAFPVKKKGKALTSFSPYRVLMVVGAGRGPLVRASLIAAQQADRKLRKVYAVEKNPNAIVT